MSTVRLYFDDPHLLRFRGRVLQVVPGHRLPAVLLDRTAFYPTGGGQPHDTGTLGPCRVVEVAEGDDGIVLHLVEGTPPPAGTEVEGVVDASRRRDHLQQHSGQHLLSAAFLRLRGAATRSFHLGAEVCDIDLDTPPDRLGSLAEVEDLANRVIAEDRPVRAAVVEDAEARRMPLRREVPVEGRVRVISIEEFDMSPCGGTHARRTGEIGMLLLLGADRHRQGSRVGFVAGDRVRRLATALLQEANEVGALLSAPRGERTAAVRMLLEERREARRRIRDLAARAAERRAQILAAAAGVVRRVLEAEEAEEVEPLARALAARGRVAVLGWIAGDTARAVAAGPGRPDVGRAMRAASSRRGLRGGGGPTLAQAGGIPPQDLAAFLQEIEAALQAEGPPGC